MGVPLYISIGFLRRMLISFRSMTLQLHYAISLLQHSSLDANGTQREEKHHSLPQVTTKYQHFECPILFSLMLPVYLDSFESVIKPLPLNYKK